MAVEPGSRLAKLPFCEMNPRAITAAMAPTFNDDTSNWMRPPERTLRKLIAVMRTIAPAAKGCAALKANSCVFAWNGSGT